MPTGREADVWVVWSFEHGAWWGPARWGYVLELAAAGRYTRDEAQAIERAANAYGTINEWALSLTEAARLAGARGEAASGES